MDAHFKFGMGHAFRCLNLALGLRNRLGIQPHFLVLEHSLRTGLDRYLAEHGITHTVVSDADEYAEDFGRTRSAVQSAGTAVVVTDLLAPDPTDSDLLVDEQLRFPPMARYIEELRELGVPVISLTDEIDRIDIRPDAVIGASCHHPAEPYNDVLGTRFFLGPEYYILGPDFLPFLDRSKDLPERARRVLLTFGGSDHDHFSLKAARALAGDGSLELTAVLGPAVSRPDEIAGELRQMGVDVLHAVPSLAGLMFDADIAVTTGGNATFELAAMGTPAVTLCTRERQARNADYFQSRGTLKNLGLGRDVSPAQIRDAVQGLASDRHRRAQMSEAGRLAVDGRGLDRVSEVVARSFAPAGLRA